VQKHGLNDLVVIMKLNVVLNGIKQKQIKEGDDLRDIFVVGFDVTVYDFDEAVEIAKGLKKNLANNLKGQTVLK